MIPSYIQTNIINSLTERFLNTGAWAKSSKIQGSETEKLRIRILSVLDSQFHGKLENGIIGQDNMLTPVL